MARLDNEELAIWRGAVADKELVDSGNWAFSLPEARQAVIKYYKTLGDILEDHHIDLETEGIVVSAVTGCIMTLED